MQVFFVLQTVIIDEFAVQRQRLFEFHRPGRGVALRVVDGNLDFESPEVKAYVSLSFVLAWSVSGLPAASSPTIIAVTAGF